MKELAVEAPGCRPLRKPSYERYARARAMLHKQAEAGRIAGFADRSGASSKCEKNRKVQDRIAWLTRQSEEMIAVKRAEIEEFYWFAFRSDRSTFYDGTRLRPFDEIEPEYRQLIEGLTFTEKGKPNLKLVTPSFASEALRKMLGLDAPAKFAPTNPEGTESYSSGAREALAHLLNREVERIRTEGGAGSPV